MKRSLTRVRLALTLLAAGLVLLFVLDSVHGQGSRPAAERVYFCSDCKREAWRSNAATDKPRKCPSCGVYFKNGGGGFLGLLEGRPNPNAVGPEPEPLTSLFPNLKSEPE